MTREQLDRLRKTPAYPFIEAAHYLNMPVSTLRAWCIGQDYKVKGSTRRFQPLIVLDGAKSEGLSFRFTLEASDPGPVASNPDPVAKDAAVGSHVQGNVSARACTTG